MVPKIKLTSGGFYFNGDFLETVLFYDGNFLLRKNDVAITSIVGRLPDDVDIDTVNQIRMADHIGPNMLECGPIAVFCLQHDRTLVYEFWSNPKMCATTSTNGFWKTTNLKAGKYWHRIGVSLLPIKVVETIDEEKSNTDIKVTKSHLHVGIVALDVYELKCN